MGKESRVPLKAVVAAMLCVALCSGCAPKVVQYVDSGRSYDATAALSVLDGTDSSAVAQKATSLGPKLRSEALAGLTRQGSSASEIAGLLTRTFPSTANGVPLYVERMTFGGKPSVLVVEAIGPEGGVLASKRLWVISDAGDVLFSGTR